MATVSCDKAFVYGTLMAEEVCEVILKRAPTWKPATLKGYRRYGVKQEVFPAIIQTTQDNSVRGQVLCGLSSRELEVLDEYESEEYFREMVQVQINGQQDLTDAYVYVWKSEYKHMLDWNSWDYEMFRQRHLKQYLENCQYWSHEIYAVLQ